MTARTYDVILTLGDISLFNSSNIIIGNSSGAVGTIVSKDTSNNTLKVKLANTLLTFTATEKVHSNSISIINNANSSFNYAVMPYQAPKFNANITTAWGTAFVISPSNFIAEKNAFIQNPIVRLYTLYYPGEWYPNDGLGNPSTGLGDGRAWPYQFPIRFAEIIGDLTTDIQYNVTFAGKSFIPFPVNLSGLEQSSDGKINDASIVIYNVDNIISDLIEDPYLVGNNTANAIVAYHQNAWLHGIDPRTVNQTPANLLTGGMLSSNNIYKLLVQARANGLAYDANVESYYGKANASFDYTQTGVVNGTWVREKSDSRDLLGGVLELKTTFANFLDHWPEYGIITADNPDGNTFNVTNSLPYRVGDTISGYDSTLFSSSIITGIDLDNNITVNRPFVRYLPPNPNGSFPAAVFTDPAGANLYLGDSGNGLLVQYKLSTLKNIRTATELHSVNMPTFSGHYVNGIFISPDGSNAYIVSNLGDNVGQFSMSTKWNIETLAFVANTFIGNRDNAAQGIHFSPTGSNVYIVGTLNDQVHQYSLGTNWNLSTATYMHNVAIGFAEPNPTEVKFNAIGDKMFLTGVTGDDISEFTLSTPWNILSAVYSSNTDISKYTTNPQSFCFDSSGFNVYIVGTTPDANIYQLRLTSAYNTYTYYNSSWATANEPVYIINDKADVDSYIPDTFKIDQLESLTEYVATFGLVSWLQYFRTITPRRKYYKNTCQWVYKSDECAYPSTGTGSIGFGLTANGYFMANNTPTGSSTLDVCSKSLTSCTLRNNYPHYGGFPGVGRTIPRS